MKKTSTSMSRRYAIRFLTCVLSVVLVLSFSTSCFDLGYYGEEVDGKYPEYYEAYGDVVAYYGESHHTYSVEESLFTSKTVNEYSWDTENGEVPVESEQYFYIAIPFEVDASIEALALYMNPTEVDYQHSHLSLLEPVTVSISAFLLENDGLIPSKPRKFGDPEFKEVEDETQPGGIRLEAIEYDDPDPTTAIAQTEVVLTKGEWGAFMLSDFRLNGGNVAYLPVKSGNILLIRIENNAGYIDSPATLKFIFTNLLIRRAE